MSTKKYRMVEGKLHEVMQEFVPKHPPGFIPDNGRMAAAEESRPEPGSEPIDTDPFYGYLPEPLGGFVLLKRYRVEESKVAGSTLIIAAASTPMDMHQRVVGKVLAAGPDVDRVSVGDLVLYPFHSGNAIGEDYLLMQQDQLHCRLAPRSDATESVQDY